MFDFQQSDYKQCRQDERAGYPSLHSVDLGTCKRLYYRPTVTVMVFIIINMKLNVKGTKQNKTCIRKHLFTVIHT